MVFSQDKTIRHLKFSGSAWIITEQGELHVWGHNNNYQLGLGHDEDTLAPTKIDLYGKKVEAYVIIYIDKRFLCEDEWEWHEVYDKTCILTQDHYIYVTNRDRQINMADKEQIFT